MCSRCVIAVKNALSTCDDDNDDNDGEENEYDSDSDDDDDSTDSVECIATKSNDNASTNTASMNQRKRFTALNQLKLCLETKTAEIYCPCPFE